MRSIKLAIVSSHPVQYYSPVFSGLARSARLQPRVFYTWSQSRDSSIHDPGFGVAIRWDVPLLDGYEHEFVTNVARRPGTDHFFGIRTPQLASRIEAWGADALLVYGWNLAGHLAAMRAFKGRIPVFFRGDSTLIDSLPGWKRALRRVVLASIYRNVDVALAVGENSRDYFRWCGLRAQDVDIAPHSVDNARFAADDAARNAAALEMRARLGIPRDAVTFAFAGKFIEKKDPLLLMEAFRALPAGAHLVMFGAGGLEARMREYAAEIPNVHLLPFQNQAAMPVALRVADVFVLPSRGPGETWGLTLNEAMAAGRAIIASSRVGGARELVVPGETGWQFPAGDLAALTAVLRDAQQLGQRELRARGLRARAHVAHWSTDECVRRIEQSIVGRVTARGAATEQAIA